MPLFRGIHGVKASLLCGVTYRVANARPRLANTKLRAELVCLAGRNATGSLLVPNKILLLLFRLLSSVGLNHPF